MLWRPIVYALLALAAMLLVTGAVTGEDGITDFEDDFERVDGRKMAID